MSVRAQVPHFRYLGDATSNIIHLAVLCKKAGMVPCYKKTQHTLLNYLDFMSCVSGKGMLSCSHYVRVLTFCQNKDASSISK